MFWTSYCTHFLQNVIYFAVRFADLMWALWSVFCNIFYFRKTHIWTEHFCLYRAQRTRGIMKTLMVTIYFDFTELKMQYRLQCQPYHTHTHNIKHIDFGGTLCLSQTIELLWCMQSGCKNNVYKYFIHLTSFVKLGATCSILKGTRLTDKKANNTFHYPASRLVLPQYKYIPIPPPARFNAPSIDTLFHWRTFPEIVKCVPGATLSNPSINISEH